MSKCPCETGADFDACCGRFLSGAENPATALEMMRARYTAHVRGQMDFVTATHHPETLDDFDEDEARRWAEQSDWAGLEIIATAKGEADDAEGTVEFIASFRGRDSTLQQHHELSLFEKVDGEWRFRDGEPPAKTEPIRRATPKAGRNDPCTCGSGKKFKKCCGKAA